MAGNTPAEAEQNFFGPLQEAVSCVAACNIDVVRFSTHNIAVLESPEFDDDDSGVIVNGQLPFRFYANWHYRVIEEEGERGPWRTTTTAYMYFLNGPSSAAILDYHWHPHEAPTFPHVHFGPIAATPGAPDEGWMLPTDRMSIESVVRQLIMQFEVPPRRPDWDATLARLEGLFNQYNSWSAGGDAPAI